MSINPISFIINSIQLPQVERKIEESISSPAIAVITSSPQTAESSYSSWCFSALSTAYNAVDYAVTGTIATVDTFVLGNAKKEPLTAEKLQEMLKNCEDEGMDLVDTYDLIISELKEYQTELQGTSINKSQLDAFNDTIVELETAKQKIVDLREKFSEFANKNLFSDAELSKIANIKKKVTNKEKLSSEDVTDLLKAVQTTQEAEAGMAEYLQNQMLYQYGDYTKSAVSLTAATVAGIFLGPLAAFAAHTAVSSAFQSFINAANPEDQKAEIKKQLSSVSAQDGLAATSLGYLASLTGASATVALQVGLLGLLVLKGSQVINAVKEDAVALIQTIRNPKTIPSAAFGFITKIATDTFSSILAKKWEEVGVISAVTVISLGSLILGGTLCGGIATMLLGLYATNRFFHTDASYQGGATLSNPSFSKWAVDQSGLIKTNNIEEQIETLNNILKHEFKDEAKASRVALIINELTGQEVLAAGR